MPRFRFRSPMLVCALAMFPMLGHAANTASSKPEIQVGILLFDDVEIIDFSAPYEVFGAAGFGVVTISPDGKPVTTAMGLRVTPDHSFANAPSLDVLLVPGGTVDKARQDETILQFVRERSEQARQVLSVCTGSNIVAGAGLLDGLKATTFHGDFDGFEQLHPKVELVRDQRWVDNGKLITSAGLSSGIDAALHLVAKLRGENRARTVALLLEYDWKPEGGFVRGKLADRYMPKLDDVKWPEDVNFERLTSVGDERHWRSRYRTTTTTTAEELLGRMATAIDSTKEWQRDGDARMWQRFVDGKQLQLQFDSQPSDDGVGYVVLLELRVE